MGFLRLAEHDLRVVLDAADRCTAATSADDGVMNVLDALAGLVHADVVFWNWYTGRSGLDERAMVSAAACRPARRAPLGPWLDHLDEHPIMSGRYGPVTAVSDVLGTLELRRTWLYQEAFRPAGLHHEIGMELPHATDEMNVVVFSRGPGRDFSDRDHIVLELMRPHVARALRRLRTPAPQLTPRQEEVLRLVGDGLSDTQVAHRLGLSDRTVGKHLEHIYARTGARSRLQAVALSRLARG